MNWISQKHPNGCVVASLAMVTEKTYDEVAGDLEPRCGKWTYPEGRDKPAVWQVGIDLEVDGISFVFGEGMTWLIDNGFAFQVKYKYHYNKEREKWPVEPWADVHIMCIRQLSGTYHATVLLRSGQVLDPLTPSCRSLRDFPNIESITAIWKVS